MTTDPRFTTGDAFTAARTPRVVTACGIAGLAGASLFVVALIVLHLIRTDIDWTRHYVSDFANGRFGWLFVAAAVTHGFGNLAIGVGLWRSLDRRPVSDSAVLVFGLAAVGVVVAALFPIDPPGQALTPAGLVHRAVVTASFPVELAALFLFSVAFVARPRWRGRAKVSFALATFAAVALAGFFLAVSRGRMPGLAERLALASFLAWELWAARQLIRPAAPRPGEAEIGNELRKIAVTVVGSLALIAAIVVLVAVVAALFSFVVSG